MDVFKINDDDDDDDNTLNIQIWILNYWSTTARWIASYSPTSSSLDETGDQLFHKY